MLFSIDMLDITNQYAFSHLLIFHSFSYVMNSPYFWGSMGFTVAISMLITAMLFDHEVHMIWKSSLATLAYIAMLFTVTFARVNHAISLGKGNLDNAPEQAYAGIATIFLISGFWFLGMLFGVIVLKLQKKIK